MRCIDSDQISFCFSGLQDDLLRVYPLTVEIKYQILMQLSFCKITCKEAKRGSESEPVILSCDGGVKTVHIRSEGRSLLMLVSRLTECMCCVCGGEGGSVCM